MGLLRAEDVREALAADILSSSEICMIKTLHDETIACSFESMHRLPVDCSLWN